MSDKRTNVPPGWVRLTEAGAGMVYVSVRSITSVRDMPGDSAASIVEADQVYPVSETPAEVLALIAAAQRAERRARLFPVVSAILECSKPQDTWEDTADAGVAFFDAIEAQERDDG